MDFDPLDKNPFDKAAHDIYSLYFIGWLFGFLAFVIGFILALRQLKRPQVSNLYASHYRFQLSIAWQGFLIFTLSFALWYLLFPYLSWVEWWRALVLTLLSVCVPIYWWVKRCVRGFKLLRADQPIANPSTFFWPKSR